jgi:hypothetical protein
VFKVFPKKKSVVVTGDKAFDMELRKLRRERLRKINQTPKPPDGEEPAHLSGKQAAKKFDSTLNGFELAEIENYDSVFYLNTSDNRVPPTASALNDENQKLNFLEPGDQIGYRFEIISLLGEGSFGSVQKCFDHKLKQHTAVKILKYGENGEEEIQTLSKLM